MAGYEPPPQVLVDTEEGKYKAYPQHAAPVTLSSSTTAWTPGSWTEIIPANAITEVFWLVGVSLTQKTADIEGLVQIGIGEAGSEEAIMDATFNTSEINDHKESVVPVPRRLNANTRVSGRYATEGVVSRNMDVRVLYATELE